MNNENEFLIDRVCNNIRSRFHKMVDDEFDLLLRKIEILRNCKLHPDGLPEDIKNQIMNDIKNKGCFYDYPGGGFCSIRPSIICGEYFQLSHLEDPYDFELVLKLYFSNDEEESNSLLEI